MNKRLWLDYSKVRSALDFGTVLSHYQLEYPTGRNQIKILCPFHDEHTPSLSINLSEGKWQCFGCSEKGNVLEFLLRMENKNPDDKDDLYAGAELAITLLGRRPEDFTKRAGAQNAPKSPGIVAKGTKQPQSRPQPPKARSDDSGASSTVSAAASNPVLDLQLTLDPEHSFLIERGILYEVARAFGIGYCAQGIMKNRIAIPIHNERGELVAYAGRYAGEELPEGVERYRLPKKFLKSHVLYNLHRAKQLEKRHLVLVEGFWSAIRLHLAGIPAAALLGTSCSERQAELVREAGFKFITVLLDGDDAGRKATPEVVNTLAHKAYVHVVELPAGMKPDTMPESFFDRLR